MLKAIGVLFSAFCEFVLRNRLKSCGWAQKERKYMLERFSKTETGEVLELGAFSIFS